MEVIILAGGLGTRLRSVINDYPKTMAPVREKPFLEYVLTWLTSYHFNKIVLSVGFKSEIIKAFFKNEFNGIPIEYSFESEPLGTGGAILRALKHIESENVLVINGDTYFPVDIEKFRLGHLAMAGVITVALKKMSIPARYGTVTLDNESNIIQFHEKRFQNEGLINGGIYLINLKFFRSLDLPSKFSFEREVLENIAGNNIKGMIFQEQFIDIGIPEDYFKAEEVL